MTRETHVDLDELVFEKRNKNYGAYLLRKKYDESLLTSLFIGTALMCSMVAIPYLVNRFGEKNNDIEIPDVPPTITVIPFDVTPPEAKPKELVQPKSSGGSQAATAANRTLVMSDTPTDKITPPEILKGLQPGYNDNSGNGEIPEGDGGNGGGGDCKDCIESGNDNGTTSKYVKAAEVMPSYPGGEEEMYRFLRKNINYPERAKTIGIQGTVYIQFVVDEYGKIRYAKVARGIGGGCDEEALRVVNMMPRWEPARQAGHNVRMQFTLPISYALQ